LRCLSLALSRPESAGVGHGHPCRNLSALIQKVGTFRFALSEQEAWRPVT
jgi:hypothetical protein